MSKTKKLTLLAVCGALAGFLNGFLGTGGGIIILFALPKLLKGDVKDNFAFCVAAVFAFCCISACFNIVQNEMPANVGSFALPALVGGFVGAAMLDKVNADFLKILFAAILIYAGINMIS